LQGKSLLPLLQNSNARWNRAAYTQVNRSPDKSKPGSKQVVGRSVRTEQWRYTEWNEGEEGVELYDYKTDPNEFENLAKNAGYIKRVEKMAKLLRKSYTVANDSTFKF
jgi:uncharacterized sulfatase